MQVAVCDFFPYNSQEILSVKTGTEEQSGWILNGFKAVVSWPEDVVMEKSVQEEELDRIRTKLSGYSAQGQRDLMITPGSYGEGFLADKLNLNLEDLIRCGDYIGETIDMARECGITSLLLTGALGTIAMLGDGILNTHLRQEADGMETLADCVLLAGGDADLSRGILHCNTADDVVEILWVTAFLHPAVEQLMRRVDRVLKSRAGAQMKIEALAFSNRYGVLGKTPGAEMLLMLHRKWM